MVTGDPLGGCGPVEIALARRLASLTYCVCDGYIESGSHCLGSTLRALNPPSRSAKGPGSLVPVLAWPKKSVSIPLKISSGARFPFTDNVSSSLSASRAASISAMAPFISHLYSSRRELRLCHSGGSGVLTRKKGCEKENPKKPGALP